MKIQTKTPEETFAIAQSIGACAKPGMVFCLNGDLGAGKTLFAQGIACGLGISEDVTSPTFNLMNLYRGRLQMAHFDLYRLESADLLDEIGFYAYTDPPAGIAVIEWADRFLDALPLDYLQIDLARGETESERAICLFPIGVGYDELLRELANRDNTGD